MMYNRYFAAILLLVVAVVARAGGDYARYFDKEGMHGASVGIHIVDVDSRAVVASYGADRMLIPASVTKTLTAATVLKCYPDTTRWYTLVGYDGMVAGDTLVGNIIVKGAIDPSLANDCSLRSPSAFLDTVKSRVEQLGISHITGNIVVDASICVPGGWGEWLTEDLGFYYGTVCHGLNYRGNEYRLYLRTGAKGTKPHITGASTTIPQLQYSNYMTTCDKDSAMVFLTPYTTQCVLMGGVPAHRDMFELECAMPDPPLVLAHDVRRALQSVGISVAGMPLTNRVMTDVYSEVPCIEHIIYSHPSDNLREMLQEMLYNSDNLYAEAILRYISLCTDSVASHTRALAIERDIWQNEGLKTSQMKLYDGSGLARKNLMTPRFIASYLVAACHDEALGSDYVSLFPQAGRDGTVKTFLSKKALPGELRLKSGSMGGVLCYAGYYTVGYKRYAVVLMSNKHTCGASKVRRAFELFLQELWGKRQ